MATHGLHIKNSAQTNVPQHSHEHEDSCGEAYVVKTHHSAVAKDQLGSNTLTEVVKSCSVTKQEAEEPPIKCNSTFDSTGAKQTMFINIYLVILH